MKRNFGKQNLFAQFLISNLSVIIVALICYFILNDNNYHNVALLLLAVVSILAIFFTIYPVLMAATMSALIWDYFFIPPHFTFHIRSSEDVLMLLMYFLIALISGVLTSRVRELEKLEMQKEERHNAIKLYKTIFNSLSHELRTPIATIIGASDMLMQRETPITEEDKTKLNGEISIAAFRLSRLVDNLLNMQRLESNMLRVKPDWCDINDLINAPVNRLRNELSTHNLQINIQNDFPVFWIDFGLMEQALFNLLHNEVLYTPVNSTIRITANYNYMMNNVILTISDDGDGFNEEELKLLFNSFYSGKESLGGTGLGLSIVKGFVEAHGGKVKAENNTPHGAKFTLEIPTKFIEVDDYLDFTSPLTKETHDESEKESNRIP